MMLRINGLTKRYESPGGVVQALHGVSLSVSRGEFVAVQGPSGSGKTTLLFTAGGLLRPDEGTVRAGEVEPYLLNPEKRARWRARTVGFVFQQYHLAPYLNVEENILAASLAAPSEDAPVRARRLMDRFRLRERARHLPAQLSSGERQRVALARALLNSPSLLLADEPTGNLDSDNAGVLLDYLADFAANGGAVLLVTHDDRVARRADRTLRLSAGQLENHPAPTPADQSPD
ncbi:MAG: ABC transporter ATP-binding protein [Planctomycetes bacterium]|nr:ABC transporter ATP-binding protein [Planctomycetota bacterium]